jgi:hypothetical protein
MSLIGMEYGWRCQTSHYQFLKRECRPTQTNAIYSCPTSYALGPNASLDCHWSLQKSKVCGGEDTTARPRIFSLVRFAHYGLPRFETHEAYTLAGMQGGVVWYHHTGAGRGERRRSGTARESEGEAPVSFTSRKGPPARNPHSTNAPACGSPPSAGFASEPTYEKC